MATSRNFLIGAILLVGASLAVGGMWFVTGGTSPPPNIVFVVLDNVRADRLSLCGHERPTAKNLEAFAADGDHSCQAYVPGAWTLPSHASFFTGVTVPEHGAHFSGNMDKLVLALQAHPLPEDIPTLAEKLQAQGYYTTMVSGNPVVSEKSGLHRGFDRHTSAKGFGNWYGNRLINQVADAITDAEAKRTPGQPIFLFVNIADAHIPWQAVPSGLDWVPRRPKVNTRKNDEAPMNRLVRGDMVGQEREDYEAHLDDVYDYAVFRADKTFGKLMDLLHARAFLFDARMVVTSDHGEFLGEHDMVSHCCSTNEANARVAFLTQGISDKLPSPMSAIAAHELVLTGSLPDVPIRMAGDPNPSWADRSDWFGSETWVSEWQGQTKHTWREGEQMVVDLTVDPEESAPKTGTAPEGFGNYLKAFQLSLEREGSDDDLGDQLKALGYAD